MATITAAAVRSLRDRTGLPMMDCKKALQECGGDENAAIDHLRTKGNAKFEERADRETAFGRFGIYPTSEAGKSSVASPGAMVELKCESAPVTTNEEFVQLASDLAQQLATGPGASTPEELLAQPSPSKEGMTLEEQKGDLFNRVREVFNVGRMVRVDGTCGSYSHNAATVTGVLLEIEGEQAEAAKDICQHIAAMSPKATSPDQLDPELVAKEREVLTEAAKQGGKPDNIVEKIVDGQIRKFYAESVLLEQAFVKDDKRTVAQYAADSGMQVKGFTHWVLGEES